MNKIAIVYMAYAWVGLIHSSFAGICLYSIWGNTMRQRTKWLPIGILFCFLSLLEIYWIPVFSSLGLSVFTSSTEVQQHFGIDAQTDIVKAIHPNLLMVAMWFFQTFLAYKIGNWVYNRNR